MPDRRDERAAQFLRRASETSDLSLKLLSLYDGFVCLYGPVDACKKAAKAANLDCVLLERALDSCMDDGDCDSGSSFSEPAQELVDALENALGGLLR